MDLYSVVSDGRSGPAVGRDGDAVVVLAAADPALPADMTALLAAGPDALARVRALAADPPAKAVRGRSEVTLLPPVPRPGKVLGIGLNYRAHAEEIGLIPPHWPEVFMRAATSLVGHGQPLVCPSGWNSLDFEGELAVVIGRGGRGIPAAQALDHVAGYGCFNDATVRGLQFATTQWTLGKNFDATGAFGPALVTADAVPPGARGLDLTIRVNGRVMQAARTDDMILGVADLIALLSRVMTLEAGDVVITGTPAGIGHGRRPPVYLAPGDRVSVTIEGVGGLDNPVIAAEAEA